MAHSVRLQEFLMNLDWSAERLAREINRISGPGAISQKAPYGWLKGAYPRGQLPELVAAILSENLGYVVEVQDIWPQVGSKGAEPDAEADSERPTQSPIAPLSGTEIVLTGLDWLVRARSPPGGDLDGRTSTSDEVDLLTEGIAHLRRLEDVGAVEQVMVRLRNDLRWAEQLHNATRDSTVAQRIDRIIAELAQLIGWLLVHDGDRARGQRYLLGALASAATAGERCFGGYVLSCLSYDLIWSGEGRDALRVITTAEMWVSGDNHRLRALLTSRRARAFALLGEESAFRRAAELAAEQMEPVDGTPPRWLYWFGHAHLEADIGLSWLALDQLGKAETHLLAAIDALDGRYRRARLACFLSLAELRFAAGNVSGAAEAVEAAVQLVMAGTAAGRSRLRLHLIAKKLLAADAARVVRVAPNLDTVFGEWGDPRSDGTVGLDGGIV